MEKTVAPGLRRTFFAGFVVAGVFGVIYTLFPEAYQKLIGTPIKQPTELAVCGFLRRLCSSVKRFLSPGIENFFPFFADNPGLRGGEAIQ